MRYSAWWYMVERATRCVGHCWGRSEICTCCTQPAFTLATEHLHRRVVPSLVVNMNMNPRSLKISPVKAELQDMSDQPQSE